MTDGRKTCISITPAQGIELPGFMETLAVFQNHFGVEASDFDSEAGATFVGPITPSEVVSAWFGEGFPSYLRSNVADISAHRHLDLDGMMPQFHGTYGSIIMADADGIMDLLRQFQEQFDGTHVHIDAAPATDAKGIMNLLHRLQDYFGFEAQEFNSKSGAFLTGPVKASEVVSRWTDVLPRSFSKHVAKIAIH